MTKDTISKLLMEIWEHTRESKKLRDGEKRAVFKNLMEIRFLMEFDK